MGRPASCDCGTCRRCQRREYMRRWYAAHPGYAAAKGREHRAQRTAYEREQYKTNPEFRVKKNARNAIKKRIAAGTMHRGECEVCGEPEAHAHHDDYTKPFDVRWMCERHHREFHGERF